MDLQPGQMLGPYRIEERLVSGGMAKVYRALQASTGREVALKVLPAITADAESIARFEREMRVVAGLQHPHILGLIDAGEDGPWHYLVLPLVRRGDLADLIAREDGPQPLPVARRIALQLCEALDYAHAQGVVHRDLKPANVLLDERGNCLLSDFGIALPEGAERLTAAGAAIGTPEYLAPEQLGGQVDPRSDLYALGMIVFQLVTGRMPFNARGTADWIRAHREASVPAPRALNPALPVALDGVVLKALAKRPEDRHQSAAEFAAALRAALPEAVYAEGALPMPAGTVVMNAPVGRESRRVSALAIAAALLAVLGAVLAWRQFASGTAPSTQPAPPRTSATTSPGAAMTAPSRPAANAPPAVASPADAATTAPGTSPPSLQPDAAQDDSAYDAFDDPRFDQRFDPSRWQLTRAGSKVRFEQRGGSMHVRSQESEHGLYAEFAGTRLTRVSARVRMEAPVAPAAASIGISISRLDRPGQWVSCYVYATHAATAATPVCTDQRRSEFRSGALSALDAWHAVALQVDNSAERVIVSADGQSIGELPFPGATGTGTWYVLLSGWSADGQAIEGDIADLHIAHEP